MTTKLTKISMDQLVKHVNMPTQHEHLICVDNVTDGLILVDKKEFYAANALRKNWQFVPFTGCMPLTPLERLDKVRTIQVEEEYEEEEEYEGWEKYGVIEEYEDVTFSPTDYEVKVQLTDGWAPGTEGVFQTIADATGFYVRQIDEGPEKGLWTSGVKTRSDAYRPYLSALGKAVDANKLIAFTHSVEVDGPWVRNHSYKLFGVPSGRTASATWDEVLNRCIDCRQSGVNLGVQGPLPSNEPSVVYVTKAVSSTGDGMFSVPYRKTASWIVTIIFNPIINLSTRKVTKERWATLTRTVTKTRIIDKQIAYTEYEIPSIVNNSNSEWSYKISELVSSDEILTEFLAVTESSGDSSGIFMVGYDSDPNIMMSVNTRTGTRIDKDYQKYYADSRRAYMTKIPVPQGTEILNIRYIKNRPPEDKTYGQILGYSKCKDIQAIMDSIVEVKPEMEELYYDVNSKNTEKIITKNSSGVFASDTSTEKNSLKIQTIASFKLPYDAARFGNIYIKGSVYSGRTKNSGTWVDFIHPLKQANFGEYLIDKLNVVNVNNNLFYNWKIYVNQYGYGPDSAYAGIKNVEIEYR